MKDTDEDIMCMNQKYIGEALSYYSIPESEVTLLRHNENMTFRIGTDYLLQIHEHIEGFQTQHIYEGMDRTAVYETELQFLGYLKKQEGMIIREPVENCHGEMITRLSNGVLATVSKWLDGESLDKRKLDDELCYQIGALTARLHRYAKGFQGSSVISYDTRHCKRVQERFRALKCVGLSESDSRIAQKACDAVGALLQKVQNEFQIIHADLSPSNIVLTKNGLAAIDFSFFGIGHPMYDIAILFGNISGLAARQKIAEGYRNAGGTIHYKALDACFVLTILDTVAIHAEKWGKQDWFQDRMKRWCNQSLKPFCRGERLFADDFFFIHADG